MVTIILLGFFSIMVSFLFWKNIDLMRQVTELKKFKFRALTNPGFLDMLKSNLTLEEQHFSNIEPIVIKESTRAMQTLKIIVSPNCLACEVLVKNLLTFDFYSKFTNIYIYISAKEEGLNYEAMQKLSLSELHQAYTEKFNSYRLTADQQDSVYDAYQNNVVLLNSVSFTPMLVLNEAVLNYKSDLKDLFFLLK